MLLWRRFAPTEIAELIKRVVGETLVAPLVKNWDSGGQGLAEEVRRHDLPSWGGQCGLLTLTQVLKAVPSNILPQELATALQIGPYHR